MILFVSIKYSMYAILPTFWPQ